MRSLAPRNLALAASVALAACSTDIPEKHPTDAGTDDTPFGCEGQAFGTTAPETITISGQALDLSTGAPAVGTLVSGQRTDNSTVFMRTTDANGNFMATVGTSGMAIDGFVFTTAGTDVPSFFFPAHPFDRDTSAPLPVLTSDELTAIGNPADTALVQLLVGDCRGMAFPDCTLTVSPAPQRIEYSTSGKPDPTATSTDGTGNVLVYGVPPGPVVFNATCPFGPLRPSAITLVSNATYFVQMEP